MSLKRIKAHLFLFVIVTIYAFSFVQSMMTFSKRNLLYISTNRAVVQRTNGCAPTSEDTIYLDAAQWQGEGVLRTTLEEPQTYVKIYGNDAISTTVSLLRQSYQLQLYGKHDRPGPVMLQIQANQIPFGLLEFAKNDDSWGIQCLSLSASYLPLARSDTILEIRFLNDGGPNGNRDAYISWVKLIPIGN